MCVCVCEYVCVCVCVQQKEEWMERRTLKRDKQELLDLQLSLKNEIEAKGRVQEQLTQVAAQLAELET